MYGSHPQSNSSSQQNSGPPIPEWRLPSTAQQRPSRKPTPGPTSPPPPPPPHPPLSASYNPSTYGSISGSSPGSGASGSPAPGSGSLDTSAWGVNYNRQQYPIYAPPPLPPRPPSTPAHSSSTQSPVVDNKPLPVTPTYGAPTSAAEYQPQWTTTNASHAPQPPMVSPMSPPPPPPPPPVPSGYQSSTPQQGNQPPQQLSPPPYSVLPLGESHSLQNSSAQQHASHSSTKVSPPQPTLSGQSPLNAANPVPCGSAQPVTAPPVPPKTSHNALPTNTSVLSSGGPSDWEHLTPTPGEIDDVGVFGVKQGNAARPSATPEPTPGYPAPISTTSSNSQTVISTPSADVSPISQPVHTQNNTAAQPFPGSSSATHGIQDPPRPIRKDTTGSMYSTASTTETSESIDGVIEAWTRPATTDTQRPIAQSGQSISPRMDNPTPMQRLSPLEIPKIKQDFSIPRKEIQSGANTPRSSDTPNATSAKTDTPSPQLKLLDPYEDLDPWSKSSLERYVAMLRKEAVADSDMERFKIFTAFMSKETKLREILYNIEHEPRNEEAPSQKLAPASQESNQKSSKATPPIESGLIPVESEESKESTDTSEGNEDGKYSPGGRPILPRVETPTTLGPQRPATQPPGKEHSLGYQSQSQPLRATSVPPSMLDKQELSPLTTNPPQPIYTPFRYTEGPQRGSDHLVIDRPAYQAYSALRQASAESGRVMSNVPPPGSQEDSHSTAPFTGNNDETFIGLIREKSVAYRKASRRKSSPPPLPMSLRQRRPGGPIDDLRSMVSSPLAKQSESSWHITTRKDLEKYSKDFGYVPEAVKSWEDANKSRREKLEKERTHRQEASEKRIDALFNGREIGYADINVLEEEFRQTEARAQLDEERQELDDYIAKVFNPLDERLQKEISALQAQYDSALGQLDHENNKIKNSVTDKYNLSHTMKTVNDIYQKLEARYQKRLEIALDREHRRKKTERRPLVFMGDSVALKQLDREFDEMEKRNGLESAKDRDERANRLMDSFDDAIMHGLGENQSLLDDVSAKLSKSDAATIRASGLSNSEIENMLKSVYNLVDSLRQDSESILHNFGIADSALNDADYGVSVAEARYSNADDDVFGRLEDDKKKEDAKIQTDLESKLDSVRTAPAEITTTINKLLKSLGKAPITKPNRPPDSVPTGHPIDVLFPGPRPTASAGPKNSDENLEHQERLRKALENAKKRNAARNTSQPPN
ncbi:hypothetical protein BDV26DRAFT_259803 [Aspergillus bertholletiae]|uniref:Uncharacterized protein n=1 Tax=Aspergillus bertholletiae TaxID=1226010 RepID=A0A5N7BBY2_9EURO|nr:hypothetical protein BDV26DRAFT_259803 [Aspergillus bertholletiae]